MNNRTSWLRHAALAMVLLGFGSSAVWAQAAADGAGADVVAADVVPGVTKPYAHARPGVNQFGTVLELPVKEGQTVKKGDVLLRQDDRQELSELKALELEANSTARVDAAVADLKLQKTKLDRLVEFRKTATVTQSEVEEQQSKVIYGEAQVKVAQLELAKANAAAEKQKIRVDQMTVRSDYDGQIEQIDVELGDVTDPQKPVMTIAQNDPLKIEFFLPLAQARQLKLGDGLEVRYPGEEKWQPAKVTYMAPIADAASDTQKIGLEMKNLDGRASGMPVQVKLPPNVAHVAQAPAPAAAGAAVTAHADEAQH